MATSQEDKEESSLEREGEDHGRREEPESAALKNLPVYGERYVKKVVIGTGETLLHTANIDSKAPAYKR